MLLLHRVRAAPGVPTPDTASKHGVRLSVIPGIPRHPTRGSLLNARASSLDPSSYSPRCNHWYSVNQTSSAFGSGLDSSLRSQGSRRTSQDGWDQHRRRQPAKEGRGQPRCQSDHHILAGPAKPLMQTSIMAVAFADGVVIGADSRTTMGSYIVGSLLTPCPDSPLAA